MDTDKTGQVITNGLHSLAQNSSEFLLRIWKQY